MDLVERRAWLKKKLRREITDGIWDELIHEGLVWAGKMDERDEADLIRTTESYLRAAKGPQSDEPDELEREWKLLRSWGPPIYEKRRRVFEECVAAMAHDRPDVRAFRQELSSFPLEYDQALEYAEEEGPHRERLDALAETLADACAWDADEAAWFVLLADYIPSVLTFGLQTEVLQHEHGPEIGTITLTVEPWLPVEVVAEVYQEAQRQMLGRKPRALGEKSLALVEFVETWGRGRSWRELLDLWNNFYVGDPHYQYADRSNFRQAYQKARKVLLTPGYASPAPPRGEGIARPPRNIY